MLLICQSLLDYIYKESFSHCLWIPKENYKIKQTPNNIESSAIQCRVGLEAYETAPMPKEVIFLVDDKRVAASVGMWIFLKNV